MLEAAQEAIAFAKDKTKHYYEHDRQLQLSLVHLVQIIGEAASRLSEQGRALLKEQPLKQVIGMRNILVHVYFDVELDTVWRVVHEDLPKMVAEIERVLGRWPGSR
jgi:uncharacterized protein with HEPN domain